MSKMKMHRDKTHTKAEKRNLRDDQIQKTKSQGAQILKSQNRGLKEKPTGIRPANQNLSEG